MCVASLSDAIKRHILFLIHGVSKTYAMTGWRIGYLLGPEHVVGAISRMQSHTTSNPTSIAQYAAIEALQMDQSILNDMRQIFDRRRQLMIQQLSAILGLVLISPMVRLMHFKN